MRDDQLIYIHDMLKKSSTLKKFEIKSKLVRV